MSEENLDLLTTSGDRPIVGVDPSEVEELIQPADDWILVRLDSPIERTAGGILVPDNMIPPPRMGRIIRQGPGNLMEDGRRAEMEAKEGERILFEFRAGTTIPRNVTDHVLIRNGSVLAVVRKKTGKGARAGVDPETVEEDVHPRADWMLVEKDRAEERTAGGLYLPDTARRRVARERHAESRTGTVVSVGPGLLLRDGVERESVQYRPGERVLYADQHWQVQSIPGPGVNALIETHVLLRAACCQGRVA